MTCQHRPTQRTAVLSLAAAIFLGATLPLQAREKARAIRVYLAPKETKEPQEFVEPDAPDYDNKLRDSVADLRRSLHEHNGKLKFVKRAAEADVVLEMMGRSLRHTGGTSTFIVPIGFGGFSGASYPTSQTVVFIRMTVGSYEKDLVGAGGKLWVSAARDAADQIDRWLDANHERIVSARGANPE